MEAPIQHAPWHQGQCLITLYEKHTVACELLDWTGLALTSCYVVVIEHTEDATAIVDSVIIKMMSE